MYVYIRTCIKIVTITTYISIVILLILSQHIFRLIILLTHMNSQVENLITKLSQIEYLITKLSQLKIFRKRFSCPFDTQ